MEHSAAGRKPGITLLAIILFLFALFALFGSLLLWGQGLLWQLPPGVDLVFPITDILVNVPATLIAALGLWKMRRWGYVASQFVAGIYVYASVELFVLAWQDGPPYQPEILVPQVAAVMVAATLVLYLWREQDCFK